MKPGDRAVDSIGLTHELEVPPQRLAQANHAGKTRFGLADYTAIVKVVSSVANMSGNWPT